MSRYRMSIGIILGIILLITIATLPPKHLTALQAPTSSNSLIAATPTQKRLPLTFITIGEQRFTAEIAETDSEKAMGLSNRDKLAPNAGMLFVFNPPETSFFWMKDMRFKLDIIWIANNKVTGVSRNLPTPAPNTPPSQLPTYASPGSIDFVLEVNAGAGASISIGDPVEIAISKSI